MKGKWKQEIDRRIRAASAVMKTLKRSVVMKRELSQKAKLQSTGESTSQLSPVVINSG